MLGSRSAGLQFKGLIRGGLVGWDLGKWVIFVQASGVGLGGSLSCLATLSEIGRIWIRNLVVQFTESRHLRAVGWFLVS